MSMDADRPSVPQPLPTYAGLRVLLAEDEPMATKLAQGALKVMGITDIVAVAGEGWTIASRGTVARWSERDWEHGGTHGYDPNLVSMGALFVAAGPGIAEGRLVRPFRNVHIYPLMAHLLQLTPAVTSGSLDSVRAVLR